MSVLTVKTQLAAVELLNVSPKVNTAHVEIPRSIPAGELPAFINKAGNNIVTRLGGDILWYDTRTYFCQLLVANAQAGISGEAEALVESFIDECKDTFRSHPSLALEDIPLPDGIQRSWYVRDTGISTIKFSGMDYIGVQYELQVVELADTELSPLN